MLGWRKYVPPATRLAKAKRQMDQLREQGKVIDPIEIQDHCIAKKFWGKQWCEHLETFADFDNRLSRGRTYVRDGSVCHLEIKKGCAKAFVGGTNLYNVKVEILALQESQWQTLKDKCSGEIGSLLELIQGDLSDHVMEIIANNKEGLFPNEGEIHFSCDCPDRADICKHIAAVLYGIGNRLDEQPDLLFVLRSVDANELITTKLTSTAAAS